MINQRIIETNLKVTKHQASGGASPYVPGVPGHTQFLGQIRVKTYVGTPSFLFGHTQFLLLSVPENTEAHPLLKP